MNVFKSRQVNLDPKPWVDAETGERLDVGDTLTAIFEDRETIYAPRAEFEPTRDPEPWVDPRTGERWGFEGDDTPPFVNFEWSPRREQFDTPVNRVLVNFRQMHGFKSGDLLRQAAIAWSASLMHMALAGACTPDEAKHARKVLTRLANWGTS